MAPGPKRVIWSPKARQDLHQVWRYFTRVASVDIADSLVHELTGVGRRLAERPLIGRTRAEVMPGLRSVLVPPYSVFYRVTDAGIEIARVLHERRNFASVFVKDERDKI